MLNHTLNELNAIGDEIKTWKDTYAVELLAELRQSISRDDLDSEDRGERLEITEKWAYNLVNAAVITLVPEARVAVHEPSSTAVDSTTQLTVVHHNWTTARDAGGEGD